MKKTFFFTLMMLTLVGCANKNVETNDTDEQTSQVETTETTETTEIEDVTVKEAELPSLAQLSFIKHNDWIETLPKFGFKTISVKREYEQEYDAEEFPPTEFTHYILERDNAGRKATFEVTTINGYPEYEGTLTLPDPQERAELIDFIVSLGLGDEYGNIYLEPETYNRIRVKGDKIYFEREH